MVVKGILLFLYNPTLGCTEFHKFIHTLFQLVFSELLAFLVEALCYDPSLNPVFELRK